MGTTPVFSEVIGISFNEAQFGESIQKLKAMWEEALGQMSGSPVGTTVNSSGSADALKALSIQMTELGVNTQKTFAEIANQIGTTFKKAATEAETVTNELLAKQKRAYKDLVDEAALEARDDSNNAMRQIEFSATAKGYVASGLDPKSLTDKAQEQVYSGIGSNDKGVEGLIAQYEDLNAKQRQWHDDMTASYQAEEHSLGKSISAAELLDDKQTQAAGKQMSLAQEMDDKRTQSAGRQMSLAEEMDEKRTQSAGRQMALAEEMDSKRTQSAGRQMAIAEEMDAKRTQSAGRQVALAEEMDAKRTQSAGRQIALAEELDAKRTQAAGRQMALAEEMDARREAMAQREGMRMAAARDQAYAMNEKLKEKASGGGGGIGSSFMSSFSSNFSAESLGNMAGMVTAFAGIGLAIGAVTKVASELVDQFKSGVEYLAQLETAASKLQGVIATNVKLSQDFTENYKLAGEASVDVVKKIQDAAIQYGITEEILTRAFKQFTDGGGATLVHNLDEAVQVTNMLSVALQAAGKDADTSRAIMAELPKMLSGTIKPTSFILETLGLTNKQWNAMVAQAKTHHDLLQQMTPLMQNYLNVAAAAGERQEALTQSIALDMKRIMAAGEQDAFSLWKDTLKQIKKFLEDNREEITAFVQAIVGAVTSLADMLISVVQLGQAISVLPGHANDILVAIRAIAWEFKDIATYIRIAAQFINALRNATGDPTADAERFGKVVRDAKKSMKELEDEKHHIADHPEKDRHHYEVINGKNTRVEGDYHGSNALDLTPGPNSKLPLEPPPAKVKVNNDPLTDLKDHLREQLAAAQTVYDDAVEKQQLLVAKRKTSTDEAANAESEAAHALFIKQLDYIDAAQEHAASLKGVKPQEIKSFITDQNTHKNQLESTEHKRVNANDIRIETAANTSQDRQWEEAISLVEKYTASRIKGYEAQHKTGLMTESSLLNATKQATQQQMQLVDRYYDALIAHAGSDLALHDRYVKLKEAIDEAYNGKLSVFAEQRTAIEIKQFDKEQDRKLVKAKEVEAQIINANARGARSINPSIAAERSVNQAQAVVAYQMAVLAAAKAELSFAKGAGLVGEALDAKTKKLQEAEAALLSAQSALGTSQQNQRDASPEGSALLNLGESLKTPFKDFAGTVENMGEAINVFHSSVNQIFEAFKHGGLLGGTGAMASSMGGMATSLAGSVGKALGPIFSAGGPILSAVGTLFSSIASIFAQEAQETAERIQKAITNAMNAYSNQEATLIQTLNALEQQRQQAISQLSGMKGGQDQLDKLLPQLDQEIAQLKLQIKEAKIGFENSLQDLELNNTALSGVFDKWQQINKAVQAYLSAGGSVSAANKYISDSLRDMKKDAGDALNQGYQTAINDALNLNNLIQQRMQMERQEAQTEFGLINGDALERRGSKAIAVGTQLQMQKAQYQQQLDNLNATIDLTQQKVNLEGQMFNLAMSTAQLQQTSNALQIDQLKEQLVILQGQRDIYDGITQGANGKYTMSQTLMNEIGVVNINVTAGGTAGDDSAADPKNIADAVSGVLQNWSRYGMGTYIAKS